MITTIMVKATGSVIPHWLHFKMFISQWYKPTQIVLPFMVIQLSSRFCYGFSGLYTYSTFMSI